MVRTYYTQVMIYYMKSFIHEENLKPLTKDKTEKWAFEMGAVRENRTKNEPCQVHENKFFMYCLFS